MVTNIKPLEQSSIIHNIKQEWQHIGEKILRSDHLALITLAGGQGTRLGFHLPKGMYPTKIGVTIFELIALKIHQLVNFYQTTNITWYIMTSSATNKTTQEYFDKNNNFGLNVKFFQQRNNQNIDFDHKPIIESLDNGFKIYSESPDGSGGVYNAIIESNCHKDMIKKDTKFVQIINIDNILVKIFDPIALGIMKFNGYKLLCKANYGDVDGCGLFCLKDNLPFIIEYFEASIEDRKNLCYGNIGTYFYSFDFFQKCLEHCQLLPIHYSAKKIPYFDFDNKLTIEPNYNNGYKLETFIFDLFYLCESDKFGIYVVDEFAPIKNATGKHSPDEAYSKWLSFVS